MRLTQAQQHGKRAAEILGKTWQAPKQDDQYAKQVEDINANKARAVEVSVMSKDDYMKLNKAALQDECDSREISYPDDYTKSDLVDMIIESDSKE